MITSASSASAAIASKMIAPPLVARRVRAAAAAAPSALLRPRPFCIVASDRHRPDQRLRSTTDSRSYRQFCTRCRTPLPGDVVGAGTAAAAAAPAGATPILTRRNFSSRSTAAEVTSSGGDDNGDGPTGDLFASHKEIGPSLVGKTASINRTFGPRANSEAMLTCG